MNERRNPERFALALSVIVLLLAAGCSSTYYATLEKFGIEKREILADRVEDARDAQGDAKDQFVDALEQYRALVDVDGGELEDIYDKLNREFERSEARAEAVSERIESIEKVAADLFEEWEDEIGSYSDASLKARSETMLRDTRKEYAALIGAMRDAESSMAPVLDLFRDQVLFLRHNLNARAIGSLQNELADIEDATALAIREMEASISEADRFVASLR